LPLAEVLDKIRVKEAGKPSINHKSSSDVLSAYFKEIIKDYDEDRVYASDIKKLISWYNTLQKAGLAIETSDADNDAVSESHKKTASKVTKKPNAKLKSVSKSKAQPQAASLSKAKIRTKK
jgi:hypothetical protein